MFSAFTKFCFAVATLAAIAGVAYGLAAGADQGGSAIFLAVSVAAAVMGVAAFATAESDGESSVAGAAGAAPERVATRSGDVARGSTWPFGAGLAVTLLAVGVATGAPIVGIAVIAVLVVAFGWLAQIWREHPNWRAEYSDRLNDRFIVPIGLPGTILLFGGIGVFSFSRLLLAVSEQAAPLIAFLAACVVLGVCALVAIKPPGKGALTGLAAVGAALVIASGIGGAVAGEREFHQVGGEEEHGIEDTTEGGDEGGDDHSDTKNAQTEDVDETGTDGSAGNETLSIGAKSVTEFDKKTLEAPAATAVNVVFENEQKGVPHNVSFYDGEESIHATEIITGPRKSTETFTTPAAGTYRFQCDVHPAMAGEFVVA